MKRDIFEQLPFGVEIRERRKAPKKAVRKFDFYKKRNFSSTLCGTWCDVIYPLLPPQETFSKELQYFPRLLGVNLGVMF